jgi:hypothetical protein
MKVSEYPGGVVLGRSVHAAGETSGKKRMEVPERSNS